MSIIHWADDDAGYEQWIAKNPNGFVANLNRKPRAKYFLIHKATCNLPDRSVPGSVNPRTGINTAKVTANRIAELVDWAKANIPRFEIGLKNYCKICSPDSGVPVNSEPTADPTEYVRRAECLLAQGTVSRPAGIENPQVAESSTTQFYRDPKVGAWVLQRSEGRCELCAMPAPFFTEDGQPFLESHHIIWLSEGGPDTPENTAALCPNCHRKMHHGVDRTELCETLTRLIIAKEADLVAT